jgi:hypothetical protein
MNGMPVMIVLDNWIRCLAIVLRFCFSRRTDCKSVKLLEECQINFLWYKFNLIYCIRFFPPAIHRSVLIFRDIICVQSR